MRIRSVAAVLGLAALTAGCAGVEVHSDWDRAVEFDRYRTYHWAPSQPADQPRRPGTSRSGAKSILDRRIRRAVDDELAAKGLSLRAEGPSDLLLVYHSSSKRHVDVYSSPYRRRHGWGASVHRWKEGTLLIEVVDLAERTTIWQGWGIAPLGSPEDSEAEVREVVAKILERFPPPTE